LNCEFLVFIILNARETHACVCFIAKTHGSVRIVIGGMDDENDTKKGNAYN